MTHRCPLSHQIDKVTSVEIGESCDAYLSSNVVERRVSIVMFPVIQKPLHALSDVLWLIVF